MKSFKSIFEQILRFFIEIGNHNTVTGYLHTNVHITCEFCSGLKLSQIFEHFIGTV